MLEIIYRVIKVSMVFPSILMMVIVRVPRQTFFTFQFFPEREVETFSWVSSKMESFAVCNEVRKEISPLLLKHEDNGTWVKIT